MHRDTRASDIREAILAVLSDCLAASGRPMPQVKDDVGLIDGIAGFDSLMALEATIALETRLGMEIPGECIFIGEKAGHPKARTLSEVVEALVALRAGSRTR